MNDTAEHDTAGSATAGNGAAGDDAAGDDPLAAGAAPDDSTGSATAGDETGQKPWDGLFRHREGRVVGGVAAGIADRFGLDPTVVRIAFVVVGVMGGLGVLIYLALWLLIPEIGDERPRTFAARRRTTRFWLGVIVLAGVAADLVDGSDLPSSGWLFALLLIGIGVALWKPVLPGPGGGRRTRADRTGRPQRDTQAPRQIAAEVRATMKAEATEQALARWRERPPRPRSYLGRLTIAAALIAGGVAAGLERADIGSVSLAQTLGLTLAVLGAGLVVGTIFGRARWLIIPALALTPLVAGFGTLEHLGLDVGAGTGERRYAPVSVGDLSPMYEHGIGKLSIDLTGLELDGATVPVNAELAIGTLVVHVPPRVEVSVTARVGAGEIELHGERNIVTDGLDKEATATIQTGAPGAGRLELVLETGMGEVQVHVDSPTPADNAPTPLPSTPLTLTPSTLGAIPTSPTAPVVPTAPVAPTTGGR